MKLVKGDNLNKEQWNEVLRRFIYRTYDKTIYPIREQMVDPSMYDELCRNLDPVWVKAHAFYVRKDGKLADNYHHCEPAWMVDTESKR